MVIIDIKDIKVPLRLINIYQSFSPQNNISARDKFKYQLLLIKKAFNENSILLGDFNLDYSKINDDNYVHRNLFEDFDETLSNLNLIQIVDFVTWSRLVGIELRDSRPLIFI